MPGDVVELLAGHKGYLSDAYRRYTCKQVQDLYVKGIPYVTVMVPSCVFSTRTSIKLIIKDLIIIILLRYETPNHICL